MNYTDDYILEYPFDVGYHALKGKAPNLDMRPGIRPGDIIETWCSVHGKTPHRWNGHRLICLECHPEKEEKEII